MEKRGKRIITRAPLHGVDRFVFVVNHQFTNAPNTTQLASGAGRSSAAGSNAAIKSPHTEQQQSVGAGGTAKNVWVPDKHKHKYLYDHGHGHPSKHGHQAQRVHRKEVIIVLNDQVVKLPKNAANASATQVASGAGKYSTSGTNSAIESAGTRQQQAVGGGGKAINKQQKQRVRKPGHKHKHSGGRYGK
ncbi:hypothetical protein [Paenibacillus cellulosilyticus]|uniref:hypothetical protein n=1 Tax=Paenibacillus cellulosilyticus TaxID=375489 RepID=UPI003CCC59CE